MIKKPNKTFTRDDGGRLSEEDNCTWFQFHLQSYQHKIKDLVLKAIENWIVVIFARNGWMEETEGEWGFYSSFREIQPNENIFCKQDIFLSQI